MGTEGVGKMPGLYLLSDPTEPLGVVRAPEWWYCSVLGPLYIEPAAAQRLLLHSGSHGSGHAPGAELTSVAGDTHCPCCPLHRQFDGTDEQRGRGKVLGTLR